MHNSLIENYNRVTNTSKTQGQVENELNSLPINTPDCDLIVNNINTNLSESVINDNLEAPKMEISTPVGNTDNINYEEPIMTVVLNNKTAVEEPDTTKEDLLLPEQYSDTLSTLTLNDITIDDLETTY